MNVLHQQSFETSSITSADDLSQIKDILTQLSEVVRKPRDHFPQEVSQRIEEIIQHLQTFPTESTNGIVSLVQTEDRLHQQFILKFSQDNGDPVEWEYLVGVRLNELRKMIPTFPMTFLYFTCNTPVPALLASRASGNSVNPICNDALSDIYHRPFLLQEKISNSVPLDDFVGSKAEQIDVFVQALLALHVAYQVLDFTHYDLHPGNVLIEDTGLDGVGVWNVDGETFLFPMKYLVHFIDFGRSHVRDLPNEWIEYWDQNNYSNIGVYPQYPKIMHDVSRLVRAFADQISLDFQDIKRLDEWFEDLKAHGARWIYTTPAPLEIHDTTGFDETDFLLGTENVQGRIFKTPLDLAKRWKSDLSLNQESTPSNQLYMYGNHRSGHLEKPSFKVPVTDKQMFENRHPIICTDLIGNHFSKASLQFYAKALGIVSDNTEELCQRVLQKQKEVRDYYLTEKKRILADISEGKNRTYELEICELNLSGFV